MDEMNEVMENNEVEVTDLEEINETNEVSTESENNTGAYIAIGAIALGGYLVGTHAIKPICKKVKDKFNGWRENRKRQKYAKNWDYCIVEDAFDVSEGNEN